MKKCSKCGKYSLEGKCGDCGCETGDVGYKFLKIRDV